MENKPFMTVMNERGKRVELELVDTVQVNSNQYVIVSEIGSEDAIAYRTEEKNGKTNYISIGDGKEFNDVLKEYSKKNK